MPLDKWTYNRWAEKVRFGTPEECWPWYGAKTVEGYGRLTINGRAVLAHRVSYFEFYGEIPDGMVISRTCTTESCVNPYHLVLAKRGAQIKQCPQGHEYDDLNTRIDARGFRTCRRCDRERKRDVRARAA